MRKRERYRLQLVWRWSSQAAPGKRALTGLRVLLRYLGLRTTTVSQGATSCALELRASHPEGPTREEALGHLRAWEPRILGAYPGSSWRVGEPPEQGARASARIGPPRAEARGPGSAV